jgi:hypothetical protein
VSGIYNRNEQHNRKWANKRHTYFSKEDMLKQVNIKISSISFMIREMQFETVVRYHYIHSPS